MRTLVILLCGFALLAICVSGGRLLGTGTTAMANGIKAFLVLWLLAAGANMWMGVARAGYSLAEEFPIFLLIFGLPAAVAGLIWWKFV